MSLQTIVGVFDSESSAERARGALLDAGVPRERIGLSAHMTADGIAAEAPGQSYERQSYASPAADTEWARYNTALRSGACAVSVLTESLNDRRQVESLLRASGARGTAKRPGGAR